MPHLVLVWVVSAEAAGQCQAARGNGLCVGQQVDSDDLPGGPLQIRRHLLLHLGGCGRVS